MGIRMRASEIHHGRYRYGCIQGPHTSVRQASCSSSAVPIGFAEIVLAPRGQRSRSTRRNHERKYQMSIQFLRPFGLFFFAALVCLTLGVVHHDTKPAHASYAGANGKIAFTRNAGGNSEIWVMDADSKNETRITSGGGDFLPMWSPDATLISFGSRRGGSSTPHAYIVNADGSALRRLTTDERGEGRATWNSDMSRVTFPAAIDGKWTIVTRAGDGTGSDTQLTTPGTSENDTVPIFSPDGNQVLFLRMTGQGTDAKYAIYLVNSDGTGIKRLSGVDHNDAQADWSPDGSRIVFSNIAADGQYSVWTMKPDGSDRQRLSPVLSTMQQSAPAWSPDGTKILYNRFLRTSPTWSDIIIVNPDGTGEMVLTAPAESGSHNYPNWGRAPLQTSPTTSPTAVAATATSTPTPTATATATVPPPTANPTSAPTTTPPATATASQVPPEPSQAPPPPPEAPKPPATGTGSGAKPGPGLHSGALAAGLSLAAGAASLLALGRRRTRSR